MIKFSHAIVRSHLSLEHLLALAHIWPHPLAQEFFRTELHLKNAIAAKMMLILGATEEPTVEG